MPFFNMSIMKILLNWQRSGLAKTTPAGPAPTPVTALIHSRFQLDYKIKFIDLNCMFAPELWLYSYLY